MLALSEAWGRSLQLSYALTSRSCFCTFYRAPRSITPLSSLSRRPHNARFFCEKNARTLVTDASRSSSPVFCRKAHTGVTPLLPEIREPPGPVRGWPTPLLTREEWLAYSKGLEQRGWHVAQINSSYSKPLDSIVLANSELRITFVFSEEAFEKDSEDFISLLNTLEKEEDHHVAQSRDERDRSIALALHTHSAIRPEAYSGEPKKIRKVPGITARDIRYVVLLENLLDKTSFSVTRR